MKKLSCFLILVLAVALLLIGCGKPSDTETSPETISATEAETVPETKPTETVRETLPETSPETLPETPEETVAQTLPETEVPETKVPETKAPETKAPETKAPETKAPETAHVHAYETKVTAPTCTQDGYTTYLCACGDKYQEKGAKALGHLFGEWKVTKEATTSEKGEKTRTCTRCGQTEKESIPVIYVGNSVGTGIGVNPGRVTWAFNPNAFTWKGSGYWWLERNFNGDIVDQMLRDTICQLAGETDINRALDALFKNYNLRATGKADPYKKGQKIAIKANMNCTGNGSTDANNANGYFPAPVTLRSLLTILVEYGVNPSDITLADPSRVIPTYVQEMCSAGKLKGVKFCCYDTSGKWDAVADLTKPIKFSHDFFADNWPDYNGYPTTNTSYWPKAYTEATYMINIFNLRGHSLAGFTAAGKNHFGSVMPGYTKEDGTVIFPNEFRCNPPSWSSLHHYVAAMTVKWDPWQFWDLPQVKMGEYNVLVDLLSNRDAGGKTFLYLCDALGATVTQGDYLNTSQKWISAPFGNGKANGAGWTNSIFASQDPIAIDSVVYDFILEEKAAREKIRDYKWNDVLPKGNSAENYLIEAALADHAPSGTVYQDGYGNPIGSLGVHDHWNNGKEKKYSRDLGAAEGIELIQITY